MVKDIINKVVKELGPDGARRLAAELTDPHHNREVAKKYGLGLWEIRVLNDYLPNLYRATLPDKKAVILNFKQVA